jgi:hypothetical protein
MGWKRLTTLASSKILWKNIETKTQKKKLVFLLNLFGN